MLYLFFKFWNVPEGVKEKPTEEILARRPPQQHRGGALSLACGGPGARLGYQVIALFASLRQSTS